MRALLLGPWRAVIAPISLAVAFAACEGRNTEDGGWHGEDPQWGVVAASTLPYPATFGAPAAFRVPFVSMRSGTRIRVALWGRDGGMSVTSAFVGTYLGGGAVRDNTPLTFDGQSAVSVAPGTVRTSDEVAFNATAGGRYAVSFAATGTVPFGQDIGNDGLIAEGSLASAPSLVGTSDPNARGVKSVAVWGAPQRIVAVLGDSIGAGMAASGFEARFVDAAQRQLGYPVVDASEGGDGVLKALSRLEADVLALPGVTDCVVQVGTNDLHREDGPFVIDGLTRIYQGLRAAGIRPWGATILPKGAGVLTAGGEKARQEANDFISSTPLVDGVVGFAQALADPLDPSRPAPGMLAKDGIHPGNAGHRAMAEALVQALTRR